MEMTLPYCGEMVRKHDPDRFLLSLLMPAEKRGALFALYAFNHEIAKTRELVTETGLGLIRLQWWRDALAGIYEKDQVPKHQVLEPLAQAIKSHQLPRDLFDNLIYAREFDLEDRLPSNIQGMTSYADFTSTPLHELSLLVLGEAKEKARETAIAYAMTGLIRALPFHLRHRRCYLPEDLIGVAGLSVSGLYEGKKIDQLKPVVKSVAGVAQKHLALADKTVSLNRRMNKLAAIYLKQLERAGYDVFAPAMQRPPAFKELRLLFC